MSHYRCRESFQDSWTTDCCADALMEFKIDYPNEPPFYVCSTGQLVTEDCLAAFQRDGATKTERIEWLLNSVLTQTESLKI
jgi:hypothetical protein